MAALRHDGLRPSNTTALSIAYRNIGEVKPDPRNARQHSKKQIRQIADSIATFGFNVPCIVDQELCVVSGHGRLAAARLLGLEQVPTICVAHLSEFQLRAFKIADNHLSENSSWDRQLLAEQLQSLKALNLSFSIESTGFELPQIELLIANSKSSVRKRFNRKSAKISDSEPVIAVTRPGDLWVVGRHRLLCGTAFEEKTYSTVMNGQHASVAFTHVSADADTPDLLAQVLSRVVQHCNLDAFLFVVVDGLRISNIVAAAGRVGLSATDLCVAIKTPAHPGPLYDQEAAFVLVLTNAGIEHLSKPQFHRSNVWRDPFARSLRRLAAMDTGCDALQQELPIAVVAEAIVESTAPGAIVLDPNLGGGAALFAAEETGRICHAIAFDAHQIDRVIRNWQQQTSTPAVHGENGRSFDVLEEERRVGDR